MHCEFRPVIANGRFFFDTRVRLIVFFLQVLPHLIDTWRLGRFHMYPLVDVYFRFVLFFSCFTLVYFSAFSASFKTFLFWFLHRLSYVFWFVSLTFFRVDYHFIFRFRSVRFSSFFAKVFSCKLKSFRFVFCPYLIHFSVRFSLTNSHFDSIIK